MAGEPSAKRQRAERPQQVQPIEGQHQEEIEVRVTGLGGEIFCSTLHLDPIIRIHGIKNLIAMSTQIPIHFQNLLHDGRVLGDDEGVINLLEAAESGRSVLNLSMVRFDREAEAQRRRTLQLIDTAFHQRHLSLLISGLESLQAIPEQISQLVNLRVLNLTGCRRLESLPAQIGELACLGQFSIGYCQSLMALPPELGQLTALQHLSILSCDSLKVLPVELGKLTTLESLSIGSCHTLAALPAELGQLRALRALLIYNCPLIEELPGALGELREVRTLELCGLESLRALPAEISQMAALHELQFEGCDRLVALPAGLGELGHLRWISIVGCTRLRMLPAQLSRLANLEHLLVEGCSALKAGAVPAEVLRMAALSWDVHKGAGRIWRGAPRLMRRASGRGPLRRAA